MLDLINLTVIKNIKKYINHKHYYYEILIHLNKILGTD